MVAAFIYSAPFSFVTKTYTFISVFLATSYNFCSAYCALVVIVIVMSADIPKDAKNFSRTPTSWDAEDDILLMHLKDQQKLGWKEIASNFNNRTPNACQFRWRRLKLGNLKNPPKSLGPEGSTSDSPKKPVADAKKRTASPSIGVGGGVDGTVSTPSRNSVSGFGLSSNVTFTGYDNNVTNALAGFNALLNASTPGSGAYGSPITTGNPPPITAATTPSSVIVPPLRGRGHSFGSPVSLDPPTTAGTTTGGGYYADVSIDPTMNLPQNQPHPHGATNGRSNNGGNHNNSNNDGDTGESSRRNSSTPTASSHSRSHSTSGSISGAASGPLTIGGPYHNNSIIQIVKDERTSVSSSTRASVSSLPSKSMNIPHHQLGNNTLAHLPVLFGTGGSISGPSPNPSISGASGSVSQQTVVSLRNGSIGGTPPSSSTHSGTGGGGSGRGYYSRSGSVVIPYNGEHKREEYKVDKKSNSAIAAAAVAATTKHLINHNNKPSKKPSAQQQHKQQAATAAAASKGKDAKGGTAPGIFKIPWSMEEDELLINRRNRELSFAELSILLPQRTEGEIWSRIDHLEKLRNGHRASRENRRRQSLIGLDDVDDFYDVDDVMIDSDDDEDDDEVLLDVDDTLGAARRKKRRASSAVNPLSVDRRRLR